LMKKKKDKLKLYGKNFFFFIPPPPPPPPQKKKNWTRSRTKVCKTFPSKKYVKYM